MNETNSVEFDNLLEYLRVTRGFDFSSYKQTSLMRRVEKRMQAVQVQTFTEYLDYLQVHQDEFSLLFNTVLINVTGFFRDPEAWVHVRDEVLPAILQRTPDREQIRVWSTGCASGEEAYTLAILFAEAMGAEKFRERVKLYATDLDEQALQESRQASYTADDLKDVDPILIEKYFEKNDSRYTFDRDLRRAIIFGKHDLLSDAPISRVDLISCRNTLMYFNAEAQEKILARFHFALNEGGFLFLGKAETMLTHGNVFEPLSMKNRIFVRNGPVNHRARLLTMGQRHKAENSGEDGHKNRLRELAFDLSPVPQIVVASNGIVSLINERARSRFGLSPGDVGRPLQDLDISYKPLELRSLIDQVHNQRRPLTTPEIPWTLSSGEVCYLDIQVSPLLDGFSHRTTSITFTDVTDFKRLQDELLHFNQELETAYEELQSTNEELQTTNEELQSTVEELETTNEELHSTNEELETMNEELQSANEELESMNEELRRTGQELNVSNAFLKSVLSSLKAGVIVVGSDLEVLAWNERARDMWGLNAEEVKGKHVLNLDIGLPIETLRAPIRRVLTEGDTVPEFEMDAINRRGKGMRCRVGFAPLRGTDSAPIGAIISVEAVE